MIEFFSGFFIASAIWVGVAVLAHNADETIWHDDAVKHHAAEYYLEGSQAKWMWTQ